MDKQLNLLSNSSSHKNHKRNSLFILHNRKHEVMTPKQIFDSKKYTELRAITFSATGSFVTKYLSNFKKIYIIEGLPENKQLSSTFENMSKVARNMVNTISDGMFSNNLVKFLNRLNNKVKTKIVKHNFDLRVPSSCVIHEKFYLLSNPTTHDTRIAFGSPNMSYQALSNTSSQYEDLWVVDNEPDVYKQMLNHFNDLYKSTNTYLSSEIRQITHKQVNDINPKHPKQQEVLTKQQCKQIKRDVLPDAVKQISRKIATHKASPDVIKGFKELTDKVPKLKQEMEAQVANNLASVDITQNVVSRSKKKLAFKKLSTIKRSIPSRIKRYKVQLHKTGKTQRAQHVSVPMVVDRPEDRQMDTDTGLRLIKDGISTPFIHPVDKKDVKHDLLVIQALMKSYSKYAYHADTDYESRAMEAILYGFTSMFLNDIRDQVPRGLRRAIPLFFFIGGARSTGKTSLLQFILQSLGIFPLGDDDLPIIKRYNDITPTGKGTKKGIVDTIGDEMMSQYVTPLPINEITDDFNYQNNGTNKIIYVMGEFGQHTHQQYSAMIGVTNNDNYNLGNAAKGGRSYYLNFGKHISHTASGSSLIAKLIHSMGDSLFMDFARRFSNLLISNKIHDDIKKLSSQSDSNNFDFLYWSRQIMKDEYKSVGLPVPSYFPDKTYDDNRNLGKRAWRVFYINHYSQFKPLGDDKMSISIDAFSKKDKYHNNISAYINLLPSPEIKLEGNSHSDEIVMRSSNFFKWIKLNNEKFLKQAKHNYIKKQEQAILDKNKAKVLAKKKINQELHPKHQGFLSKLFHRGK